MKKNEKLSFFDSLVCDIESEFPHVRGLSRALHEPDGAKRAMKFMVNQLRKAPTAGLVDVVNLISEGRAQELKERANKLIRIENLIYRAGYSMYPDFKMCRIYDGLR